MNMVRPALLVMCLVCLPGLAGPGATAQEEEKQPEAWKEFLPPEAFRELVARSAARARQAVDADGFKEIAQGKVAALMIAGYTRSAKGLKKGEAEAVRNAALRLASILGETDHAAEAKELAAALTAGKGDAAAKHEGERFTAYVFNDYDLMVPYMQKEKGGEGLHPGLQFTARLQGNQEYVENLFSYLARRALPSKNLDMAADELALTGYKTAVSAELIYTYAPQKSKRRDPKVWFETSLAMRDSAIELAEAAKKKDADAVQKAADALSRSCVECHKVYQQQ